MPYLTEYTYIYEDLISFGQFNTHQKDNFKDI